MKPFSLSMILKEIIYWEKRSSVGSFLTHLEYWAEIKRYLCRKKHIGPPVTVNFQNQLLKLLRTRNENLDTNRFF